MERRRNNENGWERSVIQANSKFNLFSVYLSNEGLVSDRFLKARLTVSLSTAVSDYIHKIPSNLTPDCLNGFEYKENI